MLFAKGMSLACGLPHRAESQVRSSTDGKVRAERVRLAAEKTVRLEFRPLSKEFAEGSR